MNKTCFVLEGGAMRGMFTAGVLDYLMDENINIDCIIGTSAGAVFGANYFSNQKGRALRYNKKYCHDPRYMGKASFLLTGNVINKRFAYYKVTKKLDPFDNETFMKSGKDYYVTATNIETGKAEYFQITNTINDLEKFRASSSVPLVSRPVKIDGNLYLDGGIADSIPLSKAQELGYEKIVVVLTQPLGFIKKPISARKKDLICKKYKNYPNLVARMENRHNEYNDTLKEIAKLEKEKKIFVIRPSEKINIDMVKKDAAELQNAYDLGMSDTKKIIKDLKNYLKK